MRCAPSAGPRSSGLGREFQWTGRRRPTSRQRPLHTRSLPAASTRRGVAGSTSAEYASERKAKTNRRRTNHTKSDGEKRKWDWRYETQIRSKTMNPESNVTEPWRQPRRSNNRTAAVQCPTCGAEPGWRCMVSTGRSNAPQLPQGPGTRAAAARANPDTRTRG